MGLYIIRRRYNGRRDEAAEPELLGAEPYCISVRKVCFRTDLVRTGDGGDLLWFGLIGARVRDHDGEQDLR